MGAHTLTLDAAVRDWVFIPLILAIALMKLLTQFAQQVSFLMQPMATRVQRVQLVDHFLELPKEQYRHAMYATRILITLITMLQLFNAPPASNKELKEIREVQAVARSGRLRAMCRFIPESSFKMRKEYYANKVCGSDAAFQQALAGFDALLLVSGLGTKAFLELPHVPSDTLHDACMIPARYQHD